MVEKGYTFIGKPSDLEAFRYMREIVTAGRRHYAPIAFRRGREIAINSGLVLPLALPSCPRAYERVGPKAEGMGLLPVAPYRQAADWFAQGNHVTRSKVYVSQFSAEGFAAGKSVSLNKGVSMQSSLRLIGQR